MALDEDGRWPPDSVQYKVRAGVLFSIYVLYIAYVVVTFAMFIVKAREKHSGLARRGIRLVVLQAIGCFFIGAVGMVSTAVQQWPCFLKLWLCNAGFLMTYSAVAARAAQHIVVSNVHNATNRVAGNISAAHAEPARSDITTAVSQRTDHSNTHLGRRSSPSMRLGQRSSFSNLGFEMYDVVTPADMRDKSDTGQLYTGARLTSTHHDAASDADLRRLQTYTRLQRYVSNRVLTLVVLGHLAVGLGMSLAINIVNDQFKLMPTSMTCKLVWGFLPVVAIVGAYVVLVMPLLLVKCWSLRDAYGIRNDLIASIVVGVLCIILTVVWETVLFHLALRWSGWFFTWVCAVSLHTVSITVPLWSARRHSRDVVYRMHGASSLGSRKMGKRAEFDAILASPHEYRYFCDFAASCFCSELTAFVDEYQTLKALAVESMASDDMWSAQDSHLDPGYIACMAGTIDAGMDYLALASRAQAQTHTRGMHLQSPPTESILDAARKAFPRLGITETTVFPAAAMDKLVTILSVFVNSVSWTTLSLPSALLLRIRDRLARGQLTLTILDEIRGEILSMLYFDVFTRYSRAR